MTKASSRRSSATASEPSLDEDENHDESSRALTVPANQTNNIRITILPDWEPPTTTATSAKLQETGVGESQPAGSEPMTASNSNSSILSTKASGGAGTSNGGATYGTRSTRTRTGTSRPNYAEDSALDAEFEIAPNAKEKTGRKVALPGEVPSSSASENGKPTGNGSKVPIAETDQNGAAQNGVKDAIPGTSSFSSTSAANAPPPSKKRKANNQNNAAVLQNGTSQPTHGNRKTVFQIAAGFRETNMLTFDNSGGILKGGTLIADDGTVLALNGTIHKTL